MIRYSTFLVAVVLCVAHAAGSRTNAHGGPQTVLTGTMPTPAPPVQETNLARVLADRRVWGKDLPTALAFVESWGRAGERRLYVFPDRVVGATQYRTRDEAQRVAVRLTEAMRAARRSARPGFEELLRGVPTRAPAALRVSVVRLVPDDEYFHVAWTGPSLQLLPPQLTVAAVRERLGPPERVVQELIQNETERRPVVLTLYVYAGGAVAFAESDWAPVPGYVDRAVLDVSAVTAALF
jgi:hypothetical protein